MDAGGFHPNRPRPSGGRGRRRRVIAKINPHGLAFLTPQNMPLVHRSRKNKRGAQDYMAATAERATASGRHYGVRHISSSTCGKVRAQLIRDEGQRSQPHVSPLSRRGRSTKATPSFAGQGRNGPTAIAPTLRTMFEPVKAADGKPPGCLAAQNALQRSPLRPDLPRSLASEDRACGSSG